MGGQSHAGLFVVSPPGRATGPKYKRTAETPSRIDVAEEENPVSMSPRVSQVACDEVDRLEEVIQGAISDGYVSPAERLAIVTQMRRAQGATSRVDSAVMRSVRLLRRDVELPGEDWPDRAA